MASIKIKQSGHYEKTKRLLTKALSEDQFKMLDSYGRKGVALLQNATPEDSGITAASWDYKIYRDKRYTSITWTNDNHVTNSTGYDFNIIILLVYGHATRNGGWVQGYNFVSEAMRPIFDQLANEMWQATIKD